MPRYTTIRVSVEDKKRLERLARLMGWSLSEALRHAIEVAERELLEKHRSDLNAVLDSLRHARDLGETSAEELDRLLYGEAE
ncbi:ribbon-helix-helix protein, CopG family [Pyrodictium abyssi]|uniref:Ribbon-helix-helix protein CopG domain-containing protein n=1 Tax=Pyrodictium abyssi TaxID=54256 RepID=A0ABM8IXU3_9CREN|nr:hypothetical protein PABY_19240 [Pyrodictium abyssi]